MPDQSAHIWIISQPLIDFIFQGGKILLKPAKKFHLMYRACHDVLSIFRISEIAVARRLC
jgi:hypothetical protein